MDYRKAVVLFNLGGPDSLASVQPFLFNLFNDKAICNISQPWRYLLAKFISIFRKKKSQAIYKQIGNKSPILSNTIAQAEALESYLRKYGEYKVFVSMRYWHPFAQDVIKDVANYAPREIILLPLYPQFSAGTSGTSIEQWKELSEKNDLISMTRTVCCYCDDDLFISAYTELITVEYEKAQVFGEPILIFSAHGLPVKCIERGEPYQYQIEKTVSAIYSAMGIPEIEYKLCYQSKIGKSDWLSPSIKETLESVAKTSRPVIVIPVSFVSEHSETLVELDIEYKKYAEELRIPAYFRVPTVSTHPEFIRCLARLCTEEDIFIPNKCRCRPQHTLCNKLS